MSGLTILLSLFGIAVLKRQKMASILDLSASSDSENDGDYVPPNLVESEFESSEGEDTDNEAPIPKKVKLEEGKNDESLSFTTEKKSAEDVWKTFLKDVESTTSYKNSNGTLNVPEKIIEEKTTNKVGMNSDDSKTTCPSVKTKNISESLDKSDINFDEKKLNDEHQNSSSESSQLKGYDPIGRKSDEVKEQVGALINRSQKHSKGLSSVLSAITGRDKKMSVLDKSKHDWLDFKERENIAEELSTFNKGKQGFIEKQRFLARSDLRLFETEKSARLGVKRK